MHVALIVKCQDSLLSDVFAADEYGHCVTGVGSVCGLVAEGRWCWPVRRYFIHVRCSHFVIAVELCNVFHVPQNAVSQMVQRVCTNVAVELSGWPMWL